MGQILESMRALQAAGAGVDGAVVRLGTQPELPVDIPLTELSPSPELNEWWTEAPPIEVEIPFAPEDLILHRPTEIWSRQVGYRWNASDETRTRGTDWDPAWLVIGDAGADPVIAHTGEPGTPILIAMHGHGAMTPKRIAPTPALFIDALSAWMRTLARFDGEWLDADDDYLPKSGFDAQLRAELERVLPNRDAVELLDFLQT